MKRIIKISLIVIAAIVLILAGVIGVAYLKQGHKIQPRIYMTDLNLSAEEREADFLEISEMLEKENSFVIRRMDFSALCRDYLPKVKQTSNSIDYGKLLVRFFAELNNGHTSALFNRYKANCWATIIDGRIFVESIRNESLNAGGLAPKDEIVAINDIPVDRWITEELPYIEASTPEYRMKRLSYNVFAGYTDTIRTYKIRNESGEKEVVLPMYKEIPSDTDTLNVWGKMLTDSVAYVAIESMNGNHIFPQFQRVYRTLKNASHIIIDIRKNGGGNSGTSEKIAQYFIRQSQKACVSGNELKPVADAFLGKVYLLIGNDTFSAAESFALDMKESGNTILIGEQTGGDTGNRPIEFQTSHGIVFRIPSRETVQRSFQGFPMEGKGIQPHFQVHQTAEDYLLEKDVVLDYALSRVNALD